MLALARLVTWWILRTLFAVEYHGVGNVPLQGAVIIAGNHPSYLDPVLVGMPVKRRIRFMAWDALFRVPVLGSVMRSFGAFPVDLTRGKGEAAYLEARRILTEGEALGIFPEGQRSESGPMGDLKSGAARLAIETGAPIIPVTIGGAYRAWPKWKLLPKPAKIIVRFHRPIVLDPEERVARRDDRELQKRVTQEVADRINRSLMPALRGSEGLEKRYRQPPSHIRSYEWAPLLVALIATSISLFRGSVGWKAIWIPCLAYFAYLAADLALIPPSRFAKWVRNSMPVWLIFAWHFPLTRAVGIDSGAMLVWLLGILLAVFFVFFYEDYLNLQKFVRGIVVVYYFSLLLQLFWPHELGLFAAMLSFIILFTLIFRVTFRWVMATTLGLMLLLASLGTVEPRTPLLGFVTLGALAIVYLKSFASIAYDVRRELVRSASEASAKEAT